MPWETSRRRETLPANWRTLRRQVFRRDGNRCTFHDSVTGKRCSSPAEECDHIGAPTDHRLQMLRSLCGYHHGIKSGSQGGLARAKLLRKQNDRFRRTEEHPGLT